MEKLQKFNSEAMIIMKDIAGIAQTRKTLEQHDKELRATLLKLCEKYGVKTIDNDFVKITKVDGSESVNVDLKKLQKMDGELYADLLEEYPKITKRKAYMRIVPKEV